MEPDGFETPNCSALTRAEKASRMRGLFFAFRNRHVGPTIMARLQTDKSGPLQLSFVLSNQHPNCWHIERHRFHGAPTNAPYVPPNRTRSAELCLGRSVIGDFNRGSPMQSHPARWKRAGAGRHKRTENPHSLEYSLTSRNGVPEAAGGGCVGTTTAT